MSTAEGKSSSSTGVFVLRRENRLDQSASVICTANSAIYISFFPTLSATPVLLPITLTTPRAVFVCANSLVVSDKVVHSRTRYNLRHFESLVSARVLAHKLGVEVGPDEKITLREFLDRWLGVEKGDDISFEEFKNGLKNVEKKINVLKLVDSDGSDGTQVGVTMDEMIALSGMSPEAFQKVFLSWAKSASPSRILSS